MDDLLLTSRGLPAVSAGLPPRGPVRAAAGCLVALQALALPGLVAAAACSLAGPAAALPASVLVVALALWSLTLAAVLHDEVDCLRRERAATLDPGHFGHWWATRPLRGMLVAGGAAAMVLVALLAGTILDTGT